MFSNKVFDAARRNDFEKVKMFIEKGNVSPATKNSLHQETLAHIAARNGSLDMLKYLLEKDPSLLTMKYYYNIEDGPCTLLALAVEHGHLEIVKYLVEKHDADIYEKFHDKYTAINWAIVHGHFNITKYFIEERNVDVDKPPMKGYVCSLFDKFRPLLFDALKAKREDIVSYLIEERKANLTVVDEDNENILYPAAREGNLEFIKNILDKKKGPNQHQVEK